MFSFRQVTEKLKKTAVRKQGLISLLARRNINSEAAFDVKPCRLHKLERGPESHVTCTREHALKFYREMQTIRQIESAVSDLFRDGLVHGYCHLCSGQEAVCVGIDGALDSKIDTIIASHRDHGWAYIRGVATTAILAEVTGRSTGCSKGKGGSMHLYAKDNNFYGGQAIVGAQVPLGAGIGFALKYKNTNGVSVSVFGEGAANQGQIYEAFNLAKLWNLPCIFVCENNHYSVNTSQERVAASIECFARLNFFPGLLVDGMDILAVRAAMEWAAEYCRSGNGPLVMEMNTYRYHGHTMNDPGTGYRRSSEIEDIRQNHDPITIFKYKILLADLVKEEELKEIDKQIESEVAKAVEIATDAPEPSVASTYYDVYQQVPQGYRVRGCDSLSFHEPEPQTVEQS